MSKTTKDQAHGAVQCPPKSCSPFMASHAALWSIHLEKLKETLKSKGYEVDIVSSAAEAGRFVMENILPESGAGTVSFGGSMTVLEAGLLENLQAAPGCTVLNVFDYSMPAEEMLELRRQSLLCDLYITSANAVTEDGVIMLLDGTCNRTAAVQFGPKKVVMLIGRNKICKDIEAGVHRVRNIAAPANAIRLNRKTPCAKTGFCSDCSSPDRICTAWTILERCKPQKRIHVILIHDEIGY